MPNASPLQAFASKLVSLRYLFLVLCIGILFLPALNVSGEPASDWVYFLGRFHPLIIHFPIVLLGLLLLLELLNWANWLVFSPPLRWVFLGLSALSSLLAVTLGYLLYRTGDYGGDILNLHYWSGIGVAVGALVLVFLQLQYLSASTKITLQTYGLILLLTNGVVVFASHQGGSLTHGTDYLTDYMPSWESIPEKSEAEMLVYEDVIVPMLDAKCYSCHNEHKTKGDLFLTSLSSMA
ncbi:MAG: hypothetical protein AAF223_03705 [Bacteroidota bacterium]